MTKPISMPVKKDKLHRLAASEGSYFIPPPRTIDNKLKMTINRKPTGADLAFFNGYFVPDLNDYLNGHPVESINVMVKSLRKRVDEGTIILAVDMNPPRSRAIAAALIIPDGKSVLRIFLPTIMRMYHLYEWDIPQIRDMLICTLLHEEYHLVVQKVRSDRLEHIDIHAKRELEAWWFTVKKCIIPIQDAGGLANIPDNYVWNNIVSVYKRANGDSMHPEWVALGRSLTGME
ncbi:hypothetical protein ACFLZY_03465 [Patescibacteria group bacterium]